MSGDPRTLTLVQLALSQVGTREEGHNSGEMIAEYQSATWLEPGPWPWCAAFCCWLLREWVALDGKAWEALKLTNATVERWRCRDASAFGWIKWAKQKGILTLPDTALAKAGDFVVYDFSHCGVVVEHQIDPAWVVTVEGNTNGAGGREGDGVWKKRRASSLVQQYVRLIP